MITFNNSLLTIAFICIKFVHSNCSPTLRLTQTLTSHDYENKAKILCKEHLGTKYNTDDNAGPENFKKSYKLMSMPEINYEFRNPRTPEDDHKKIQRLFKRELLLNYMYDLHLSWNLLNLEGMLIPEKWCEKQLSTVNELITKTPYIKEKSEQQLRTICDRFTTWKLGIRLTAPKAYLHHHGFTKKVTYFVADEKPERVFELLFLQWSNRNLDYKTLMGVTPPDTDTDESLENEFFIQHFSIAYFKHFEEAVDNNNYENNCVDGEWSYMSVNEFCASAAKEILDYVEFKLMHNVNE